MGRIEITNDNPPFAHELLETLKAGRADAGIVEAVGPLASICISTEGLSDAPPAARHFRALQAARAMSPGTTLVFLDRTRSEHPSGLGGMSGLSKTIRLENSGRRVFTLTLMDDEALHSGATAVASCIARTDRDLVLGDGAAFEALPGDALSPPSHTSSRDAGQVWLVTGGARGVTSDCAVEVARRTGGTFVLLGRTSPIAWPNWLEDQSDLMPLRAHLARMAGKNGVPATPKAIDQYARQLIAGREIGSTLQQIAAAGATARYVQCDLANSESIRTALSEALTQGQNVTGLIHGAGVLADAVIEKQTTESFKTVFGPKVDGLLTLMGSIDTRHLRHCGLFSSASAVFGNPGQANYAAANAWLNAYASDLSGRHPAIRVRSFCWGPWEGGMVDASLAKLFGDRGISLIPRHDGAQIFADQLLDADHRYPHLVVGDTWGGA